MALLPALALVFCSLALAGCSPGLTANTRPGASEVSHGPVVLALTSEIQGYTEPCGCSEELQEGGLARMATVLARAKAGARWFAALDGGDLLTQEVPVPEHRVPQEELRAEVMLQALASMGYSLLAPGELDLWHGEGWYVDLVRGRGLEVIDPLGHGRSWELLHAPGLEIGVAACLGQGLVGTDRGGVRCRVTELGEALAELRGAGARVTLVLGHCPRAEAREVIFAMGDHAPDFWLVAHGGLDHGGYERVGKTYMLEVWTEGRRVGLLSMWPGPGGLVPGRSTSTAADQRRVEARLAHVERQLASVRGRSPELAATLERRVERYHAELERLRGLPRAGTPGTFTWVVVPVTPDLPPDQTVERLRTEFNRRLREVNLARAPSTQPVEGGVRYAGSAACEACHREEYRQWRATEHAGAYQRLVARGKEFDDDCVSCHVTGYREPGGATLGRVGDLGGVGCESCHGPSRAHATQPESVEMPLALVPEERCRRCHVPRHSPGFDYRTYLGRIVGPGHGRGVGG